MTRYCELEEFEGLADAYIDLCQCYAVNNELFGGQLDDQKVTINLQAKEIIKLKDMLDTRSSTRMH